MHLDLNRDWLFALLSGLALAAACGFRAFLPLLALAVAAKLHWLTLKPELAWLGQDPTLWALGLAAMLEVLGDKIPVVDHALDSVGTVLRPAAAALAAYALFVELPSPWAQILAIVLGGAALSLHLGKAGLRLTSTGGTGGLANPILSIIEDMLSLGMIAIGFFLPLLILLVLGGLLWRRTRRRGEPSRSAIRP